MGWWDVHGLSADTLVALGSPNKPIWGPSAVVPLDPQTGYPVSRMGKVLRFDGTAWTDIAPTVHDLPLSGPNETLDFEEVRFQRVRVFTEPVSGDKLALLSGTAVACRAAVQGECFVLSKEVLQRQVHFIQVYNLTKKAMGKMVPLTQVNEKACCNAGGCANATLPLCSGAISFTDPEPFSIFLTNMDATAVLEDGAARRFYLSGRHHDHTVVPYSNFAVMFRFDSVPAP